MSISHNEIKSLSNNERKIDSKYYYYKELGLMKGEKMSIFVKITDLDSWKKLNLDIGTRSVIKINESLWILTASIPFENIETISILPYVLDIDLGSPIHII